MYGGRRVEERPVEDERSEETSQGETPRFHEGERLGEAFGGDPITVVDTQGSILKTDQTAVDVDLDVLPRTGKDKIFPQGKTNNYILKNVTGAMRETEFNYAFDTIATKPRERYEILNTVKTVSENMSLFFGKDAVPQTFAIARCRVVEGDGLRPNSNKDEWTSMGKDLYTGIIDKDPNSVKDFFDKVGNIRFDSEVTEVSPGTFNAKSAEELANLDQDTKNKNTAKRLRMTIEAIKIAEGKAKADAAKYMGPLDKMAGGGELVQWKWTW